MNCRNLLSKYRSAIMGFAAIVIILFHLKPHAPFRIYNLLIGRYGNMGVDVFLFVSGFGLAHSLKAHPDFGSYYARRLSRVLPPWYARLGILLPVSLTTALLCKIPFNAPDFIYQRILPIGTWFNVEFPKWYVSGVLGYYVVAAMLYPLLRRSRFLYLTSALLLAVAVCYVPFISQMDNAVLAITRFPALIVGLTMGIAAQTSRKENEKWWAGLPGLMVVFAVGILLRLCLKPLSALPNASTEKILRLHKSLLAPLLTVLLAGLFQLADRVGLAFPGRFFGHLGRYSLELYLVHTDLAEMLKYLHVRPTYAFIGALVLSYPAARLLNLLGQLLLKLWRRLLPRLIARECVADATQTPLKRS